MAVRNLPRRRRRRGRMGIAPGRHRHPRPVRQPGDGRHLLCRPERRLAAVQAEDQLRPDPRAGDLAQHRRRQHGGGRQAGAAGRFLGDRGAAGGGAGAVNPGRSGARAWSGPRSSPAPRRSSFLLFAEVVAATATVSESALIYFARKRNMAISVAMLVIQVLLSIALILLDAAAGLSADLAGDRRRRSRC